MEQGYTIVRQVLTTEQIERAQPMFDHLLMPSTGIPVATSNPGDGGRRQMNAGGPYSGGLRPGLAAYAELPSVLASAAAAMADTRPVRLMQTPIPCVSFPEALDATYRPEEPPADRQIWSTKQQRVLSVSRAEPGPEAGWRGHVDWGESAEVLLRGSKLHELWRFGIIHFSTLQPGGGAFVSPSNAHSTQATTFSA